MLTKIIYPSQGYTEYQYGTHIYDDEGEDEIGGGVRINRIIKHDGYDHTRDIKYDCDYSISDADNSSSGKLIGKPVFALRSMNIAGVGLSNNDTELIYKSVTTRYSTPQATVGRTNSSYVGYRRDYYPSGLQIAQNVYQRESALDQRYKYNGKELQPELGLNWYHYGVRMYDAGIGRFMTGDPASAVYLNWAPYHYVLNNPIRFIDPTGSFTELFNTKGKKIGKDGTVSIITNDDDVERILANTKAKMLATADDVSSGIQIRKIDLAESLDVLNRAMANGGLREESSVVTGDGEVIRGETGPEPIIENINGLDVQAAEGSLPDLPDGTNKKDATLIHSHPIEVQIKGDKAFPQTATKPSAEDAGTFVSFGTNIIVGNLSTRLVTKDTS